MKKFKKLICLALALCLAATLGVFAVNAFADDVPSVKFDYTEDTEWAAKTVENKGFKQEGGQLTLVVDATYDAAANGAWLVYKLAAPEGENITSLTVAMVGNRLGSFGKAAGVSPNTVSFKPYISADGTFGDPIEEVILPESTECYNLDYNFTPHLGETPSDVYYVKLWFGSSAAGQGFWYDWFQLGHATFTGAVAADLNATEEPEEPEVPYVIDSTGLSAKTYVPNKFDFIDYYDCVGDVDEQYGGGAFTCAYAGMLVPLNGRKVVMDTSFKEYSNQSAEVGGDGVDAWLTYSFGATPAAAESDHSFPQFMGADGYYINVINVSKTEVPNCAQLQIFKVENKALTSVAGPVFIDGYVNKAFTLVIEKGEGKNYVLSVKDGENTVMISGQDSVSFEIDERLWMNEKGQTFFSTAIYEGPECTESDHSEHRGINVYSFEAFTYDADGAVVTLDKDEYEYDEDTVSYRPNVTVVLGDTALVKNVDYEVNYKDNKEAGTAKVIVTFINGYAGNADVEKTFVIKAATPATSEETPADSVENGDSAGCFGGIGVASVIAGAIVFGAAILLKRKQN